MRGNRQLQARSAIIIIITIIVIIGQPTRTAAATERHAGRGAAHANCF